MDKKTFGELILKNEIELYRIAKSILKKDDDCADAVQEAIVKAFEKLHTLRQDAFAKTWMIRILIHECYRIASQRKKEYLLNEEIPDCRNENYGQLYLALEKLEMKFRIVLVLHYLEGYEVEEIAKILNIPKGTVKSRLYRGREKMRKILGEEEV